MSKHEQFSHDVKAEMVQVMHLPNRGQAELHKAGCAHAAKATQIFPAESGAELVEKTTTIYRDDYYHVAPCARKAG